MARLVYRVIDLALSGWHNPDGSPDWAEIDPETVRRALGGRGEHR
ncbi:hypothetical protein GCM10009785_01320 [Brooklawnia cerclae]|uniref:Uncharacterized protein n=1 Tax=Brooklawnia cerclae TaxID=349934 RepID=A0ABX0SD51_9ACTN|nr:hypothetical protein [Brooklawnia cerclae]NIH56274.1 hypothetical protein [Brooklawnia cerclae]